MSNSTASDPRRVDIFISSPGDVREERDRARQVVDSLRRRYAGRLDLRPLLWEDLPLQPDMSFQQGIDAIVADRGVEVAVFILWSRLGSPTGPLVVQDDGTPYRSGTEREYDLIMQARAKSLKEDGKARPAVLIYTRRDDVSFDERLRGVPTEEKQDMLNQRRLVDSFITEQFQDAQTGTNLGAYLAFDRPVTFQHRLRTHLEGLLDGMAGMDGPEPVWDIDTQGLPFLGLAAYQFEHAPVFFGREDEAVSARQQLRSRAREGRAFLLISGGSGSGKSSLARAGVMPAVVEHEVDASVERWRHMAFTPGQLGTDLVTGLAHRLAEVLPALQKDLTAFDDFAVQLRRDPDFAWRQFLRRALPDQERLLLLVDQMEELFSTDGITDGEREAFGVVLEALARSGSIWVLATMRSDFSHRCQGVPALVRLREGGGEMDLLPPTADSIARVITDPARLAGLTYERRSDGVALSDVLLREGIAHRELLPFLSHVLRRLAEERTPDGLLTFAAYEEKLGGKEGNLREALANYAEQVFQSLPEPSRATLPDVWAKLITLGGDDAGQAVRRYPRMAELTADSAMASLVHQLIKARLFTAAGAVGSAEATVTVVHETLLRVWPRATEWIAKNRECLQIRGNVERYQALWVKSGPESPKERDKSLLLPRGLPLRQARELRKHHGAVEIGHLADYIRLSLRHAFWQTVRGVTFLPMLGALGLGLITFGVWSGQDAFTQASVREIEAREVALPPLPTGNPDFRGIPDEPNPLLGSGEENRPLVSFSNSIGVELIYCWPGEFTMGSPLTEKTRSRYEVLHRVRLTRGFWLGRFEVTQGQWEEVMNSKPSSDIIDPRQPVTFISWYEADEFCRKLTEREKPGDWAYVLPTEAQWEYACRAGTTTSFSFGNILDGRQANCMGSMPYGTWIPGPDLSRPTRVGSYRPNAWGFFDMHGNVSEWCRDWHRPYKFTKSQVTEDPIAHGSGGMRIHRGGSFALPGNCRSAKRGASEPDGGDDHTGFRLAAVPASSIITETSQPGRALRQ